MTPSVASPRTVGVLICTYRRPDSLAQCLAGLARQQRIPDDVVVVMRDGDDNTQRYLAKRPLDAVTPRVVTVRQPGTVHALSSGLDACRSDVLAITDDDTVAHPDWLARILDHFRADPLLGALGGRDRCHDGTAFNDSRAAPVGRISWLGRPSGNHHAGYGGVRDVDYLKGANMSYRATAFSGLRFDSRLRGTGAQPYEDACFSLAVRRRGWRTRYDPQVLVDHFPGQRAEVRHYSTVGSVTDAQGFRDHAYNNVVCYWDEFAALRQAASALWSLLLGTSLVPGLGQAIRYTPRLGAASWQRFALAQQGRLQAYRDLMFGRHRMTRRGRRATMSAPPGQPAAPRMGDGYPG